MAGYKAFPALLAALILLSTSVACGGDAEERRAALEQEELSRDLDLALRSDSLATTFEDSAVAEAREPVAPEPEAPEPQATATPSAGSEADAAPEPRPQPRPVERPPAPEPRPEPRPEPAPQPRVVTRTVPVGTTFAIRLNETLSTETSRPGDRFSATLSESLIGARGEVVIPAGATINGVVTGVQKSGRIGETAVLKLAFESVTTGSRTYGMQATVVEANPQRETRTTTKESAVKIGAGAAAGAILGQVFGHDTESTLKGAAIGAVAGTAIAMGTADVDAVLPAGSRVVIRLDAPVEVNRTVS